MRWRGRRQSSNVEDRRGQGGGFGRRGPLRLPGGMRRIPVPRSRRSGVGGIGFIVAVLLISWLFGINPLVLLDGGTSGTTVGVPQTQPPGPATRSAPPDDEMGQFVAVVLAETEDTWHAIFDRVGETYQEPRLVLFERAVSSACGFAQSATGPFYCPGDQRVYIDLAFYRELKTRFDAPGDFAQAYVIAHEVGHHVQNLIGVLPRFNQLRQRMSQREVNAMSIRVELQADCFAGIWAHYTGQKGLLETGDIEEALNAARQIGDDAIQRRTQGYVVPESFNHGTSEQRMRWFTRGYEGGRMDECDTFNTRSL